MISRLPASFWALTLGAVMAIALPAQALAQSPPVTPQDFANAAGGADQYEIMAARTALAQSQTPSIRAFAQEMITAHGAMISTLRAAAQRDGLKPPGDSVGADQTMLLSSLQSLRGADFDRAYARQQVLAHHSALTTERSYGRAGSDATLRGVANADTPMIERHLQAAQDLQRSTGE